MFRANVVEGQSKGKREHVKRSTAENVASRELPGANLEAETESDGTYQTKKKTRREGETPDDKTLEKSNMANDCTNALQRLTHNSWNKEKEKMLNRPI